MGRGARVGVEVGHYLNESGENTVVNERENDREMRIGEKFV